MRDFVYVYVPELPGDELYVFDSLTAAEAFARFKGYDPSERIREEPLLDLAFVRDAATADDSKP